jgi:hypothetical protein
MLIIGCDYTRARKSHGSIRTRGNVESGGRRTALKRNSSIAS